MTKFVRSPFLLRVGSGAMGLISILGGIAALGYSDGREPYRYLAAALVLLIGGILWLVRALVPKYQPSRKHSIVILAVLFLGLIVGLVDVFSFCGGECGCFWYLGYPGRWLRISTCVNGPTMEPIWRRQWDMDVPSFVADVVFWSGAGIIVAAVQDSIAKKKQTA